MGKHSQFKKHHHKKHKKHKHQKPIPKIHQNLMENDELLDVVNVPSTPVRFTNEIHHEKQKNPKSTPAASKPNNKKRKGKADVESDSEEERWLDAIESGKLEEVDDELKKIKNPKLMTARQRAMYERGNALEESSNPELLMSLPTGYKEKVITPEAIQKAQLKSLRRKQLADEKREKDKKKTMERLLKKQETKQRGAHGKNKLLKIVQPMITYKSSIEGSLIHFPPDFEIPLKSKKTSDIIIPKPIICSIEGCTNLKRYNCSKTNVPLCSFQCYKINVDSMMKKIIC